MKKASVHKAFFALIVRCFFILMVVLTPAVIKAQTRGTVKVYKDPLIDTLIAKRNILTGSKGRTHSFSSSGYRIQIFSGSNRREAYEIQARFQSDYPGIRTYISYRSPNFKVHVGDFRTRLEAEKMVRDMSSRYTSIFIIATKINPPKAEIND